MKKNSESSTKKEPKEQTAKRTRLQRPVQRKTKEVLAELVEKLRWKLELKTTPASLGEAGQRPELRPNLLRARDALVAVRTELINTTRGLVKSMGTRLPKCSSRGFGHKAGKRFRNRYGKHCSHWCS